MIHCANCNSEVHELFYVDDVAVCEACFEESKNFTDLENEDEFAG